MSVTSSATLSSPGLRRAMGLSSLVVYGLVVVQPTAPMPLFGAAAELAHGHVVTTVLIAMCAMLFTAISYGKMATAYPSAGSAYAYVVGEIHPSAGYVVGWGAVFDYAMNPTICVIWTSKAAMNLFPSVPFPVFALFFATLFTVMNLRRIESSTRTNYIIATALGVVIVMFLAAAVRYLLLGAPLSAADFTRPFYDPETFSVATVSAGASLAVLTYFGFDGISTLSEEVRNPRRNIIRATVLVCVITGLLSSIQVYVAQLVWPQTSFPDQDTAFCFVAGKVGGQWLFHTVNAALLVAVIGSGSGAHLASSRLLYAMGRDGAIPRRFFGELNPKTGVPAKNIILVGTVAFLGALSIDFALGAQLVNFGALIAFMGVNAACFTKYFLRASRRSWLEATLPMLGFAICLYLWINLGFTAKVAGFTWLATGIIYGAYRTAWFRKPFVPTIPKVTEPTSADTR